MLCREVSLPLTSVPAAMMLWQPLAEIMLCRSTTGNDGCFQLHSYLQLVIYCLVLWAILMLMVNSTNVCIHGWRVHACVYPAVMSWRCMTHVLPWYPCSSRDSHVSLSFCHVHSSSPTVRWVTAGSLTPDLKIKKKKKNSSANHML